MAQSHQEKNLAELCIGDFSAIVQVVFLHSVSNILVVARCSAAKLMYK